MRQASSIAPRKAGWGLVSQSRYVQGAPRRKLGRSVLLRRMNASISFQDCERKSPPTNYPVTFIDAKPAGIDLKFSKGIDPRTRLGNVYNVSITPAIGTGSWCNKDDEGGLEQVKQTKLPQGNRVEGIWCETGERRVVVLEFD